MGIHFGSVFVGPSDMANDYSKQEITGDYSYDDLKNRCVEEIHGIVLVSSWKLRFSSLKISSQQGFYDAACVDRLPKLQGIIKQSCIANFGEIVDGINQYKELIINSPQFVLGINVDVDYSTDGMTSSKHQKLL